MARNTTANVSDVPAATDDKEPARYMVNIQVSKEFKEAIGKYAESKNLSEAAFARQLIADTIEYDLSAEPTQPRGRANPAFAGLTDEQKKVAQKVLRKSKNDLLKQLLAQRADELAAATAAAVAEAIAKTNGAE